MAAARARPDSITHPARCSTGPTLRRPGSADRVRRRAHRPAGEQHDEHRRHCIHANRIRIVRPLERVEEQQAQPRPAEHPLHDHHAAARSTPASMATTVTNGMSALRNACRRMICPAARLSRARADVIGLEHVEAGCPRWYRLHAATLVSISVMTGNAMCWSRLPRSPS